MAKYRKAIVALLTPLFVSAILYFAAQNGIVLGQAETDLINQIAGAAALAVATGIFVYAVPNGPPWPVPGGKKSAPPAEKAKPDNAPKTD